MRSSDLNVLLKVLEPTFAPDADGRIVQGYQDRGSVWANMRHRPGSEAFQQSRMEGRSPATVMMNATPLTRRIGLDWRVETATTTYDVKGDPFLTDDRRHVVFQVEGQRK